MTTPIATIIPAWNKGAQCALPEEPWFRFIHDHHIGFQNKYDDDFSNMGSPEKPYPFMIDVTKPITKITRTIMNVNRIYANGSESKYTIDFGYGNKEDGEAVGITNVRFTCPQTHTIEAKHNYIELEIGGQRIDRVYTESGGICTEISTGETGRIMYTPNIWLIKEGRVLPLLQYHNSKINICFNNAYEEEIPIQVEYDLVTIQNVTTQQLKKNIVFPSCQLQFTGTEVPQTSDEYGRFSVKCNFNHPLLNIHLQTNQPLQAARLVLNRHTEIPFTKNETTNDWSINFTPFQGTVIGDLHTSLNASRFDYICIDMETVDGKPPGEVNHWALTHHPGRMMAGMSGLMFTK